MWNKDKVGEGANIEPEHDANATVEASAEEELIRGENEGGLGQPHMVTIWAFLTPRGKGAKEQRNVIKSGSLSL